MTIKKKKINFYSIFIFLFVFIAPVNILAQQYKENHIIILFDKSGSVMKQTTKVKRANQYLQLLLMSHTDSLKKATQRNNDVMEFGQMHLPIRLFGEKDVLSLLSFGINEDDILNAKRSSTNIHEFIHKLSQKLVSLDGVFPNEKDNSLQDFLRKKLPHRPYLMTWYNYTLSRYAIPSSLNVIPEIFAGHNIFIVVSDYRYGEEGSNIGDRNIIKHFAREYLDITDSFVNTFNAYFIQKNIFTIYIGGEKGLKLKVFELLPAKTPTFFTIKQLTSLEEIDRDHFKLSNFSFNTIQTLGEYKKNFRIESLRLILLFPKTGKTKIFPLDLSQLRFRTSNEIELDQILIQNSEIPKDENVLDVTVELGCIYNYGLSYNLRIPITHSFTRKGLRIYRKISGPPMTKYVIGGMGFVFVLFAIWGLGLRKPKLEYFIGREFKLLENYEYKTFEIPWAARFYNIKIEVQNDSDWLNLRWPKPEICVEEVERPASLCDLDMQLEDETDGTRKLNFGESVCLKRLSPGHKGSIPIVLNLTEFPEPKDKTEPLRLNVTIQCGHKKRLIVSEEFQIVIMRHLGPFWLGIDPGTTASCIAGGEHINDINEVGVDGETVIIPSVIVFLENFVMPGKGPINRHVPGIVCGTHAKKAMRSFPERAFYSAKKLVGYENTRDIKVKHKIKGAKSKKNKRVQFKEIKVKGSDALSILDDYLIKQAHRFFKEERGQLRINKAVVAVPNNFTPLKIEKMKACIENSEQIKKVLHIYEAEAIALYYLSIYNKLNKKRQQQISMGIRENILIFDVGGGSLNASIIGLTRPLKKIDKTRIEILARVGYGIGGETFDRIVAEIIWKKFGQVTEKLIDPFKPQKEIKNLSKEIFEDWNSVRSGLKDCAETVKIKISDKQRLSPEDYVEKYSYGIEEYGKMEEIDDISIRRFFIIDMLKSEEYRKAFKQLADKSIAITLDEILENKDIKYIQNQVREAIQSVTNIFREEERRPIHTIIYSGRGSFFPDIRKWVSEVVKQKQSKSFSEIDNLDEDKVKTAVAIGATYYAVEKQNIELTRNKTFANYGYVKLQTEGEEHAFRNVIPINTVYEKRPFGEEEAVGEDKDQEVIHNGNLITFYQVNSEKKKAQEIINRSQKYKFNIITQLPIQTDFIKHLELKITSEDKFKGYLDDGVGKTPIESNVEIQDILDDTYEKSAWLLA